MAVLAPIEASMFATGFLVILDMILGILAAKKRKEPITSAALRRTVSKMCIYQVTIFTGYLIDHYIAFDSLAMVRIIGGIVGSVELKSVVENLSTITNTDLLQSLLKRLGSANDTHIKPPDEPSPK